MQHHWSGYVGFLEARILSLWTKGRSRSDGLSKDCLISVEYHASTIERFKPTGFSVRCELSSGPSGICTRGFDGKRTSAFFPCKQEGTANTYVQSKLLRNRS